MTAGARRHLVLVGLMGAGKTTVGEACAQRLGRAFVDVDQTVEAVAGRSVAEIFRTDGEAAFRDLERRAVADVAASPAPLVIACGGGAVLDTDSRRALRETGFVVWLRATPTELARVASATAPKRTVARCSAPAATPKTRSGGCSRSGRPPTRPPPT